MTNILRIRTLTQRFFEGTTTLAEEQELYRFYGQDDLPHDLRDYQELFRDLAAVQSVAMSLQQTVRKQHRWIAAAAVAALLTAGGATLAAYHQYERENECVAIIYGERTTDRDVVMGEMQKTMTAMADDGSDLVEEQLKAMFGND